MKMKIARSMIAAILLLSAAALLTSCGAKRVTMSKSLYIANETDVAVVSLLLDVEGKPLTEPIEALGSPLEPGEVREVVVGLPEKQAKKGKWTVLAVTEEGEQHSKPFAFGDLNPHGENPVLGFYVQWFEEEADGHYSAGVSKQTLDEFLSAREED